MCIVFTNIHDELDFAWHGENGRIHSGLQRRSNFPKHHKSTGLQTKRCMENAPLSEFLSQLLAIGYRNASQSAKRKDIADGIAAETVRSVDAAGEFAYRMQPRNHLAIAVDHLRILVDDNAAHGVVHAHA